MKCKRRGGEHSVKYGKRKGKQCYLRGQCKRQFVSAGGRHTLREEQSAVSLYSQWGLIPRPLGRLAL